MRRIAVERREGNRDQIGMRLKTPEYLSRISGPLGAPRRLQIAGTALLEALEALKPMLHYSVVNGVVLLTEGTSIYVTGRTKGGGETLVSTVDFGEPMSAAMARLNRLRRLLVEVPDRAAYAFMKVQEMPDVAPPQVLLSDVIEYGEALPITCLAGCGGAAPVAIAIGNEEIEIKVDHRLYDPPHMTKLAKEWTSRMENLI